MVVFKDGFRKYYVLVLPIEASYGYDDGNIGLLKYYRKKGKANSPSELSANWNPPSKIYDKISDSEFEGWKNYILKNTSNRDKKSVIKLIFMGKFSQ